MEIHKNTNKQLNDLFSEARNEKPVMNLKEVEGIIRAGKYTPSGSGKGFHIGLNNLIVVCGIVVSSFLTYMALKVDSNELKPSTQQSEAVIENGVFETPGIDPGPITGIPENNVLTAAKQESSEPKVTDRVQPKQNPSTLLASKDNNLAITDNDAEEDIAIPVSAKLPSGEYDISFNYAGQDIKMKLIGDEVSEFMVDGNFVPAEQYADYADILDEGKNYLIGNTQTAEQGSSLNLIKFFDSQLRADKILDKQVHYYFELSSSHLTIDGSQLSNDMFLKYKGLYEAKTGKTVTQGSVYKFERGAKSR